MVRVSLGIIHRIYKIINALQNDPEPTIHDGSGSLRVTVAGSAEGSTG